MSSGLGTHHIAWRMMVLSMDGGDMGFSVYHYVPDQVTVIPDPTTACGLRVPGRWARFDMGGFLRDARYEVASKVWNHGDLGAMLDKVVCPTCRTNEEFQAEVTAALLRKS